MSRPQEPSSTPPARTLPRIWAVINTTPCLSVIGFTWVGLVAITSWYGCQATEHSSKRDHGVYVAARGSSCCVYEEGEENGVVNAHIGSDLGNTGVNQRHAKLRGKID